MPRDGLEELIHAAPGSDRVAAIRKALTESLRPVRPLPPDAVLVLISLAVFLALTVVGALPVGFSGFHAMGEIPRMVVYPTVLIAAVLLSMGLVEQTIPGSRRRVPALVAVLFPFVALGLAIPLLFPDHGFADFVREGYPCLRLGLICAVPAAIAAGLWMRRGCVTDLPAAMVTAGAFSGLVGVGTLALHCPNFNSLHILVWHLGAIPLCILVGAVIGFAITWDRART
jgi:hypothetical protein